MSDTPRTDKASRLRGSLFFVETVVSESLERELNAANAELAKRTAEVAEAWLTNATLRADLAKAEAERDEARRKNEAIEAIGYEWRWTLTLDADGNQIGVWFMRDEVEREEAKP